MTLTIGEDEDEPALSLAVSPESIREDQVAAVTATLEPAYRDQLTVTVTATPVEPATGDDYVLSPNALTFAGGSTASSTVTVTAVPDDLASPPTTVRLDAESTETLLVAAEPVTLTITDVQARPTVSLVLSAEEIAEADGVANVTAALDVGSVLATTLSVTVQAVAPALAGDFRQHGVELTVPAGQTASSGAVTVTAVPDDVDAADGTYAVSAEVTGGYAAAPADLTLTIADDDEAPEVELLLDPQEIEEGAGSVTVTARLSGGRSGEVTTVAVEVEPDEAEGGYEVSEDVTLTIAARERESVGTVTVTPDDDEIYGPASRTLTVSGTATNARGVTDPTALLLEITEDEAQPVITLALSADTIGEAGGAATVTAALSGALDREAVLAVAATPETRRFAGQAELGGNDELTFAAGQTASSGIVTVTAVNDSVDAPDTVVTVSGVVSGADLAAPAPVTLTVSDDDEPPTVTLRRSSEQIDEGATATVVAVLNHASSADTVVQVTATSSEYQSVELSGSPLVIRAGQTASTGTVMVTAVDNLVHTEGLTVTVSGAAQNARGVGGNPKAVTIVVKDNDTEPAARLLLNPRLVKEGESSRVTARLSRPSGELTTIEVGAVAGAGAVAGDFSLSEENTTLTIAAGAYRSTGTVTVTAEDDELFGWAREVTVSGTASNPYGVTDPDDRTLTIEEDDAAPAASLELSAEAIDEGGTAAVTLSIATAAKVALRYEVTAQPEDAADRDAETDYSLGELTVAVGQTESGGTLTVTAPDNETDEPDRVMAVTAEPGHGDLSVPAARTLTIRDDDAAPVVTLMLSRSEIRERGDDTETTVTATLDRPSSAVTTVRVSADPVAPAEHRDFRQVGSLLTFPPGATGSTGSVLVRAADNSTHAPDRSVRITGVARNRQGIAGDPEAKTLVIRDADTGICDRSRFVQDAILAALKASGYASDCGDVTAAHLASIVRLALSAASEGTPPPPPVDLQADDLAGLTNLRTFDAGSFRLGSVASGAFAHLHAVRTIDLSGTPLTSLPAGVFADLRELREVNLSNTSITALPDAAFAGASSLTTLRLEDASLPVLLVSSGPGSFRAYMASAAPFDLTVPFTVDNGTVPAAANTLRSAAAARDTAGSDPSVTIQKGHTGSERLTIKANPQASAASVTVSIGTLPALLPRLHSGYRLTKEDTPLRLFAAGSGTGSPGGAPQVTLRLSESTISEDGGSTAVTARLAQAAQQGAGRPGGARARRETGGVRAQRRPDADHRGRRARQLQYGHDHRGRRQRLLPDQRHGGSVGGRGLRNGGGARCRRAGNRGGRCAARVAHRDAGHDRGGRLRRGVGGDGDAVAGGRVGVRPGGTAGAGAGGRLRAVPRRLRAAARQGGRGGSPHRAGLHREQPDPDRARGRRRRLRARQDAAGVRAHELGRGSAAGARDPDDPGRPGRPRPRAGFRNLLPHAGGARRAARRDRGRG